MKNCGFFWCKLSGSCMYDSVECIHGMPCHRIQGNICKNCFRLDHCRDGKESLKNGKHGTNYR